MTTVQPRQRQQQQQQREEVLAIAIETDEVEGEGHADTVSRLWGDYRQLVTRRVDPKGRLEWLVLEGGSTPYTLPPDTGLVYSYHPCYLNNSREPNNHLLLAFNIRRIKFVATIVWHNSAITPSLMLC